MAAIDQSVDNSIVSGKDSQLNKSYEEEDSYVNPSNVSKINQSYVYDVNASMVQVNTSVLENSVTTDNPKSSKVVPKKSKQINRGNYYGNINDSNILVDGFENTEQINQKVPTNVYQNHQQVAAKQIL